MVTKLIGLLCVGVFLGAALVEVKQRGKRHQRRVARRGVAAPHVGGASDDPTTGQQASDAADVP